MTLEIMEIIFELVQIFVCILEAYLMIDFFSAFFPIKERLDKTYTKTALICGAAFCVYVVNLLNSSTVNIVSMQFIYISIIFLFFQGKLHKKILYYITATVVMIGSEFLFIVLLSLDASLH